MHISGVGKASAFPERSENDTLERSSGTPPPRDVPLVLSATANQPITHSSERALCSSNPSQQGFSSWKFSHSPPPDSLVLSPEYLSTSSPPQTTDITVVNRLRRTFLHLDHLIPSLSHSAHDLHPTSPLTRPPLNPTYQSLTHRWPKI